MAAPGPAHCRRALFWLVGPRSPTGRPRRTQPQLPREAEPFCSHQLRAPSPPAEEATGGLQKASCLHGTKPQGIPRVPSAAVWHGRLDGGPHGSSRPSSRAGPQSCAQPPNPHPALVPLQTCRPVCLRLPLRQEEGSGQHRSLGERGPGTHRASLACLLQRPFPAGGCDKQIQTCTTATLVPSQEGWRCPPCDSFGLKKQSHTDRKKTTCPPTAPTPLPGGGLRVTLQAPLRPAAL